MTVTTARELDELRREIDRIDESIVDLLGTRLRVVREIARAKHLDEGKSLALRPAREALILRRLIGHDSGQFPKSALVRMWRELFAAMTRVQSPFSVCAYVPPGQPELWDIARDHFGSLTPLHRAESAGQALRVAGGGGAHVAVLPLPTEADRWWSALLDPAPAAPRVVARLPFVSLPGYPENVGGLVLASLPAEPTGDDLTLLALETDGSVSSARIRDLLAPLSPRLVTSHRDPALGISRHLVEITGFIEPADPHVSQSLGPIREQTLRVVTAGCYARPLPAPELG